MFISLKWLKQYLPKGLTVPEGEMRERITFSLAEVESIHKIGEGLTGIVVGEVKEIKDHPKSSNLHIVKVDVGTKDKRTIVCGAPNLFEGARVPVVLPKGSVLNPKQELGKQEPVTIGVTQIKQVTSEGMLCSPKELGIENDHTKILILGEDLSVGSDFVEFLKDTIIEIENKSLTHRPDCFSHIGIARELASIFRSPFDYQEPKIVLKPTQKLPFKVNAAGSKLCKRYTAISIKGVKVKPSPSWLQAKLFAINMRPVNNIVDISNYIMFDLGQPVHIFDLHKLSGPEIIVRTAKSREKVVTLDDSERSLDKTNLLICDPKGPIAIAGIMGSKASEVGEDTKDIIIESANFEMYNIRRSSRELGLRTEASTRFEKGLDPNLTLAALTKTVSLITEIAGGEIASEVVDYYPETIEAKEIDFDLMDVPRLLGVEIPREQILDNLRSLGFEVISPETSLTAIKLKIPTFRQDLTIKEDILEEIARTYGYDKFKPSLPQRDLTPVPANLDREFDKKIRLTLASLGFDEIYSYSFIGEEQYKKTSLDIKECLKIKNPLSPELGFLRSDLAPSLLEKIQLNLANFKEVSLFELSRILLKEKAEGLPKQPKKICAVYSNSIKDTELFLTIKGSIENLLAELNVPKVLFEKSKNVAPYLHPQMQANITIADKVIGYLGIVHPTVLANWKIKQNSALFMLDYDLLFKLSRTERKYHKISRFPEVKRDLSFWIDEHTETDTILKSLMEVQTNFVKNIEIIDIFKLKGKSGDKSVTIEIVIQSDKHTLKEAEINNDIAVISSTIEKLKGKLRK